MAEVGVREPDLDRVSAVDFLRGFRGPDGLEESVLISILLLAQQLMADGPLADKLAAIGATYDYSVALAAELPAVADGKLARVFGEPVLGSRGVYKRIAAVWTRIGPLPEGDTAALDARVGVTETDISTLLARVILASLGAGSANKIPGLGGDGTLDPSFLPLFLRFRTEGFLLALTDGLRAAFGVEPTYPFRIVNPFINQLDARTRGITTGKEGELLALTDGLRQALGVEPVYPFRLKNPWLNSVAAMARSASVLPYLYILSDSRGDQVSDPGRTTSRGWLWPLQVMTGARFHFQNSFNFGKAGDTTGQMRERVTLLRGLPPGYVVLFGDTNDRGAGWTAQQTLDNLQACVDALLRYGHKVIVVAGTPRGDTNGKEFSAGLADPQLGHHLASHRGMLAMASQKNVYVANAWPAQVDPASANAKAKSIKKYDGLHDGPPGSRDIADAIAPIILTHIAPVPRLVSSNADIWSDTNPTGSVNGNPLLLGTAGTGINGTTITGVLADGWAITAGAGLSAVCSKETINGVEWQKIVVTGAPTAPWNEILPVDPSAFSVVVSRSLDITSLDDPGEAVGQVIEALGEIDIVGNPTGLRGVPIVLKITTASGTKIYTAGEPHTGRGPTNLELPSLPLAGVSVVERSDPITEEVDSASIAIMITGAPHLTPLADTIINATVRFRAISSHFTA